MIKLETDKIYSVSQCEDIIKEAVNRGKCYKSKKCRYYNMICAFDIETSNIIDETVNDYKDIYIYHYLKGLNVRVLDVKPLKHDIKFSNEYGENIDELYDELVKMFPGTFKPSYDESEQIQNIIDVYDANKPDDDINKFSIMYCWQFAIDGHVIFGRTWFEFLQLIRTLEQYTDESNRILIYVHNLAFEFQFIRKLFEWSKVFAIAPRKPIYALTTSGLEFRCSYILTNYSLNKLSDQLHKYTISKLDTLDYDEIRTPKTPMTWDEIRYCINDVLVVSAYIQECVLQEKFISRIPLTATGYCRRYCRKMCYYSGSNTAEKKKTHASYRALMKTLTISGADEYKQLRRAFMGGFTHCSAYKSGLIQYDVDSIDFTSSYPYALLSEQYPMSKGRIVKPANKTDFEKYLKYYCCVFDAEFINIESTYEFENYISTSHCFVCEKPIADNGRLVSADRIITTITNVDFDIIRRMYKFKHMRVKNLRVYKKGYLPKNLILSIIKLYQDKTQLKGVIGKEQEYGNAKALLNSVFGMTCTDISKDEFIYSDEWEIEPADIEHDIELYNNSMQRFLFYPWGIFCTAYSRRNLLCGILNFKDDYIYSDTDSIKCINLQEHMKYVNLYNELCEKKLKRMCNTLQIDYNELLPRTIKGELKPLGVWDIETADMKYTRFKSLGAKRYMIEQNGNINITVAGVNKKAAVPYLMQKYKDDIFKEFDVGLSIPAEHTGKLTHLYIDDMQSGQCIDKDGNVYKFRDEPPGVFLEKAPYYFDITEAYLNYIKGVQFTK